MWNWVMATTEPSKQWWRSTKVIIGHIHYSIRDSIHSSYLGMQSYCTQRAVHLFNCLQTSVAQNRRSRPNYGPLNNWSTALWTINRSVFFSSVLPYAHYHAWCMLIYTRYDQSLSLSNYAQVIWTTVYSKSAAWTGDPMNYILNAVNRFPISQQANVMLQWNYMYSTVLNY